MKIIWANIISPATFTIGLVALFAFNTAAVADELRILDSTGLVRAVRVVRGAAAVTVKVEGAQPPAGECVAANLDGLATEKRQPISTTGVCLFTELASGTWQIDLPRKLRWRVTISE